MSRHVALAPAKLNLGLEVVGRRPDGYHDLVTIMQTISLYDRLTVESAPDLTLTVSDPALAGPDNLALRAAQSLRSYANVDAGASLHLEKTIPVASGLGGASSDAATTLLALRRLWQLDLPDAELARLAASLGSDVPFFLHGGTALVTGRGDHIEPLPPLSSTWFVVVAPAITIPRKTATLYGALTSADYTSGADVLRQADRLRRREPPDPALMRNAFRRPLCALRPDVDAVAAALERAGAPFVALSGAGPVHYTALSDPTASAHLVDRLLRDLGDRAAVLLAQPAVEPV